MNILLLFFAFPVATIIFAIVFQKLLKSPILVALTIFAVFLIVTFAAFTESFLVFAIVYTILAYITAVVSRFVKNFINAQNNNCNSDCECNLGSNCINNSDSCNILDEPNSCDSNNRANEIIVGNRYRCNRRAWR